MIQTNRMKWTLRASATPMLCVALLTTGAMAATPKLESITVIPVASSIAVEQKQNFTATGTFSDGTKHALGPDFANIAAGNENTCALLSSGGVECWGPNTVGQLGDGNTAPSPVPHRVARMTTAKAVTVGYAHACALLTNGVVQCWGLNNFGELGNGTNTNSELPVSVSGITTATAVAGGFSFSCALLADGRVQCWGDNQVGTLGNGTNTDSNTPVFVTGVSTAVAIATGFESACALLASGGVECWGANGVGQLGDGGTELSSNTPVPVQLEKGSARAISTGGLGACALLSDGTIQCWGDGGYGQLGNGSYTTAYTPTPVSGLSTAVAIAAGLEHACALLRSGAVMCWGSDQFGQLGDGGSGNSNVPVLVSQIKGPTKLTSGWNHVCALFSGGLMTCWGADSNAQLGIGYKNFKNNPPLNVIGTPGVVWASSNTSKATITYRGVATGRAVGNTTITATTAGSINDNAVLTVK